MERKILYFNLFENWGLMVKDATYYNLLNKKYDNWFGFENWNYKVWMERKILNFKLFENWDLRFKGERSLIWFREFRYKVCMERKILFIHLFENWDLRFKGERSFKKYMNQNITFDLVLRVEKILYFKLFENWDLRFMGERSLIWFWEFRL